MRSDRDHRLVDIDKVCWDFYGISNSCTELTLGRSIRSSMVFSSTGVSTLRKIAGKVLKDVSMPGSAKIVNNILGGIVNNIFNENVINKNRGPSST